MRRLSVRRERGAGEVLLVAVGLLAGVAAGFGFRALVGRLDRQRVRSAVTEWTGRHAAPATGRAIGQRIDEALAADEALAGLGLETVPVGPGRVELHGWVPTRAARARAIRLATQAAGGTEVVNRLLAPDEDEPPASPPAVSRPA
jgi:hypothetical protein